MVESGVYMFRKGDKVVYPHHGAGVIKEITKKSFQDEKKKYYVFQQTLGEMMISVPVDNVENVGIRSVISQNKARKVLKVLSGRTKKLPEDWNQRFKINNEKMGSGDIFQVAEVVRDLSKRDGLSTREKRMLSKAKKILTSELMHSLKKDEENILNRIDKRLN
jgi:CarD family transcriptional regulator